MKVLLKLEVGVDEHELNDFIDEIAEDITNGNASREYVIELEEWDIYD